MLIVRGGYPRFWGRRGEDTPNFKGGVSHFQGDTPIFTEGHHHYQGRNSPLLWTEPTFPGGGGGGVPPIFKRGYPIFGGIPP